MSEIIVGRKINKVPEYHTARYLFKSFKPEPGMKDPNDIVQYEPYQKVVKVGDGEEDYVLEEAVKEVSRVNRQQFIAEQASDVGVLNILKKVSQSGDVSLLNQTGATIPEGLQDYSEVPSSIGEALNALKSGSNSFAALKAIFGDISFETLANMSPDELSAALQKYVESQKKPEEGGQE